MRPPICIFRPGHTHTSMAIDLDGLVTEEILNQKVVVVSIAGRYRQGKSFLMNFIIRYLRAGGASDWLERGDPDILSGFDWRHTKKPVTVGVLIWPEVFKLKTVSGEEVVVILIDTQGIFDRDTTIKDCTSIFSLSVLLSSMQIFNVKRDVQGDDLSHLQLFSGFGRLISAGQSSEMSQKPFQDLIFFVRDWEYSQENPYGWEGGRQNLEEVLRNVGQRERELEAMRADIKNCFESLRCFLMPHPGKIVATSPEFRGNLGDIEPEFVSQMKSFIGDIFRPDNLKPKRVHGKELSVRDWLVFVERYAREMDSGRLPTPKTLYDATVHATNSAVVNNCFEAYQAQLSRLIETEPMDKESFRVKHSSVLANINTLFDEAIKMGDQSAIWSALKDLKDRIAAAEQHFEHANSLAYEKLQFDARIKQLLATQRKLAREIEKFGDMTGDLTKRLRISQEESAMIEKSLVLKQNQLSVVLSDLMKESRRVCRIL